MREFHRKYSNMTKEQKDQFNQDLKDSQVTEVMNNQFNSMSNTIILNNRNNHNFMNDYLELEDGRIRNPGQNHAFNLVRANNLYARDRGMEFFCLCLLFCTSGQVMDQMDNIGVSMLMTTYNMTINAAAF